MTLWAPLCLDDEERAAYLATGVGGCRDCTEGFATDMRAEARCNGIPGEVLAGVVKEEPMEEPITIATRRVAVEVTAPCDTCIHAGICRIQPTLVELRRLAVSMPTVDEAIAVELTADVSCAHYVKARGAKPAEGTTPRKNRISPEGLERMRESGRRLAERRAAEREAVAS